MERLDRRGLIILGAGLGVLGLGCSKTHARGANDEKEGEDEVAPPEGLMREHGVLNRILLVSDNVQLRTHRKAVEAVRIAGATRHQAGNQPSSGDGR